MSDLKVLPNILIGYISQMLPFAILCIYPFRNKLRYSKRIVAISLCLQLVTSSIIFSALYFINYKTNNGSVPQSFADTIFFILLMLNFFVYSFHIQDIWQKKLSVFLLVVNIASIYTMWVNILADYHDYVFNEGSLYLYSNFFLKLYIPGTFFLVLLLLKFMKTWVSRLMLNVDSALWVKVMILNSFYFIMMVILNANTPVVLNEGKQVFIYMQLCLTLCFIVSHVFIFMILLESIEKNKRTQEASSYYKNLKLFEIQYEHLHSVIESMRHSRHDFHHHMNVLLSLLENEENTKAIDYLRSYQKAEEHRSYKKYCEHTISNSIFQYFSDKASYQKILLEIEASVPDKLPFEDIDISIIINNLLENGLEACSHVHSLAKRKIVFHLSYFNHCLVFTMDNTYNGSPLTSTDIGTYLSTKPGHTALGLSSIHNIAEKYNGTAKFEPKKNLFCSSVLLYEK